MELLGRTLAVGRDVLDATVTEGKGPPGQFCLIGADVILDETGHFWLLEFNGVPSISFVGWESIRELTRGMLAEMVDIELEIRDKTIKEAFTVDTKLESAK